jgi:hypothetical protein
MRYGYRLTHPTIGRERFIELTSKRVAIALNFKAIATIRKLDLAIDFFVYRLQRIVQLV